MMQLINSSLAERPIEAQFISMIYALWDDSDRTLRIANSGLPRPMYCRQGKVERIEATGLPMGLFPVAEYDEFTYRALPGDVFVFFSDGILDAVDNTGESYGSTRLRQVIEQTCQKSATEIVAAIFKSVDEFVGGVTAFDDQTVVAIRVKDQAKRK
jgi:sigma-B regulation protein RsbU (phosphoserine phosphatase)